MRVICPYHPYGEHIDLVCSTCGTRYSTKNIDHIGARSIIPGRGYESCKCKTQLIHECPKEMDWLGIDQHLAMYRRQGRDIKDVERILEDSYGGELGQELFGRYRETFASMSTKKALGVERMLYESREGFSPHPKVAREQARKKIEEIAEELRRKE